MALRAPLAADFEKWPIEQEYNSVGQISRNGPNYDRGVLHKTTLDAIELATRPS